MKYNFEITGDFARDFARLAKTRKTLSKEFDEFLSEFDHTRGDFIPKTSGAQKIRMRAAGRGKRKGYRIIYYFVRENTVHFLAIYSKAIKEDLSAAECKRIRELVAHIKGKR